MADTNINIYLQVADNGDPTNPQDPGTTPQPEDPTKNKGEKGKEGKTMTQMVGAYIGKQALDMATSRVGQVTRSNLKQAQTNAAIKNIGYGVGILGAVASQNYAAAAMMVVSIGVDMANRVIDYNFNLGVERQTLSISNQRAGNMNRSR